MVRLPDADRLAPFLAGIAGLIWLWSELAPQRTGFEDTDNPATGVAFLTAHPDAWQPAGLALLAMGFALIVTVLATRARLVTATAPRAPGRDVAVDAVAVLGLLSSAMLVGMGCVRLSGGPLLYVAGLDQTWGEMAYTVTQFVGVQLLLVGGMALLALWIVTTAWLGARGGAIARPLAALAILPGIRLLAIPGFTFLPGEAWFVLVAALPAAFLWLVLLGAWRPSPRTTRIAAASPTSL